MLGRLFHDLRFAARSIRRKPSFTGFCVFILAIGIGAVTTVFSTMNAVVLRPLPFPEADRLVWIWATDDAGSMNSLSALDYFDYRDQCEAFDSVGAHLLWKPGRIVTGQGTPERIVTTAVSASLFSTLGVEPLLGRTFAPEEEVLGGQNVVILSHSYWQTRLGGNRDALGSKLTIDGAPFEVIAIMPEDFAYPRDVKLWFPMQRGGSQESGRGNNNFFAIGRLADGVTIEKAQADIGLVAANIAEKFPASKKDWGTLLVPLHERFFGDLRPTMMMLMGAVCLVLLIVCANLSSLALAKLLTRRGELALRLSLGASQREITSQLLVETLVISAIGALGGIGLAMAGIHILKTTAGDVLPRLQSVTIDGRALLVVVAATAFAGLLAGLVPALQGPPTSLVAALKDGRGATGGRRGLRLRRLLVTAQVALSVILLIGAGLLIRSLSRLQHVDPGLRPDGVLTADVQLPAEEYSDAEAQALFVGLLDQIRAIPGVMDAAAADQLPLFGGPYNLVYPAERPPVDNTGAFPATRRIATDGFFKTLGIPLVAGREFVATDRTGNQLVTVISKALAAQMYPDGDAIGSIMVLPWGDGLRFEIVGIAEDVRDFGLATDFRPAFYMPFRQFPGNLLRLAIRTDLEPTSIAPALRSTVWALEKDAPVFNIGTMEEWLSNSTDATRLSVLLLSVFAAIAMILSATGLYGVLAFLVAQRHRDIGVRMALGAGPVQVIRWVVSSAGFMAGSGLVIGLIASPSLAKGLANQLFGVEGIDTLTYLLVTALVGVITLLATALPAWRAVKLDPAIVLRNE